MISVTMSPPSTITAYGWTLSRDGSSVRFVLADSVAVTIESVEVVPSLMWSRQVSGWTHSTAANARETALIITKQWEEAGYALRGYVLSAEVTIHLAQLTKECLNKDEVGPILEAIVESLTWRGRVLDT